MGAGWHLAKLSLRVVWSDGSLSALVVLGGIASGAVALAFLVPAAIAYEIEEKALAAVFTAIGVYLATLVATYFAVALAAAAADVLDGHDATVRGAMAVASRLTGPVAGWALVLTTVNLVLQLLRERAGILGSLLLGAAGVAWSLATFLVVPILALEGLGPLAALDRSSELFRAKWGEQLVGTASIGILFAVFGTVPAVLLVFLGLASGSTAVTVVCVVVGILGAVVAGVLGSAARSVFSVALYRYAAGVGPTGPFTAADLESAVARKR
ncbi:MAG TPA: DUF6159 family protein [Gaiella sp.]|nr:DUF6159 family protein [Gaiella sp.]